MKKAIILFVVFVVFMPFVVAWTPYDNINLMNYYELYNAVNVSSSKFCIGVECITNWTDVNDSASAITDTQKGTSGEYIYNDTSNIYINGTELNTTVEQLDTDTTYDLSYYPNFTQIGSYFLDYINNTLIGTIMLDYLNLTTYETDKANLVFSNETLLNNTIDTRSINDTEIGLILVPYANSSEIGVALFYYINQSNFGNEMANYPNNTILSTALEDYLNLTDYNADKSYLVWINESNMNDTIMLLSVNETELGTILSTYSNSSDLGTALRYYVNNTQYNTDKSNLAWQNESNTFTENNAFNKNLTVANSLLVGGDNLYVDNSSGKVGINTTSPTHELNVEGNANITDDTYIAGNVFINESNVGIGTASPGANLDVKGGSMSIAEAGVANAIISSPENFEFGIDSDNGQTDRYFSWQKDSGTFGGGTELMRLQEDGKVGIGRTPSTGLDMEATGVVDGLTTSFRQKYDGGISNGWQMTNNAGKFAITTTGGDVTFWLDNQAAGNSFAGGDEKLVIKQATGNVGIGTTAPTHELNVQGNANITSNLYVEGSYCNATSCYSVADFLLDTGGAESDPIAMSELQYYINNTMIGTALQDYVNYSNISNQDVNSADYWDALDAPLDSWTSTYNASYDLWAYNQTSPADECSEIDGCVENALTSESDPIAMAEFTNYFNETESDGRYLQSYTETDDTAMGEFANYPNQTEVSTKFNDYINFTAIGTMFLDYVNNTQIGTIMQDYLNLTNYNTDKSNIAWQNESNKFTKDQDMPTLNLSDDLIVQDTIYFNNIKSSGFTINDQAGPGPTYDLYITYPTNVGGGPNAINIHYGDEDGYYIALNRPVRLNDAKSCDSDTEKLETDTNGEISCGSIPEYLTSESDPIAMAEFTNYVNVTFFGAEMTNYINATQFGAQMAYYTNQTQLGTALTDYYNKTDSDGRYLQSYTETDDTAMGEFTNYFNETESNANFVSRNAWTDIDSYPSACTGYQVVQGLADSLSCYTPQLLGDTSPQLGGYLDTNSYDLGSTSDEIENIYIGSDSNLLIGDGQEGNFSYNGSCVVIKGPTVELQIC